MKRYTLWAIVNNDGHIAGTGPTKGIAWQVANASNLRFVSMKLWKRGGFRAIRLECGPADEPINPAQEAPGTGRSRPAS